MAQLGGVVSAAEFCTLTVTVVEVPMLPAASYALATNEWLPLPKVVVSKPNEKGVALAVNPRKPSRIKSTRVTPVLSAAVTLTVMVPETVNPLEGEEMLQVGGVLSGGGGGPPAGFETLISPSGFRSPGFGLGGWMPHAVCGSALSI